MKRKMIGVLAAVCLITGITACGSDKASQDDATKTAKTTKSTEAKDEVTKNAMTATIEQNGAKVTMVADAKGDTIVQLTQTGTIDTSSYSDEDKANVQESIEKAKETYSALDGVEYSTEDKDGVITETIKMDLTGDKLQAIIDSGALPVEGDTDKITELSVSQTKKSLEDAGWTIE